MKLTDIRVIGLATVVAGLAIIGGVVAYDRTQDSSETAPASEDTTQAVATPSSGCTMDVTGVVFTLDPLVAEQFALGGLGFRTISPGNPISSGLATAPRIHTSRDVACDLSSGYVGMRGGFAVERPTGESVEFRRFRMELSEGEMYAFLTSTGNAIFQAIDFDVSQAQFTERGSVISGVIPMVLEQGAATAMNAELGTDFPAEQIELGTFTVTGTTARTAPPQTE